MVSNDILKMEESYDLQNMIKIDSEPFLSMRLVECVPNFSNGIDSSVVEQIVGAIKSTDTVKILDIEMDASHNRSVVTFIVSFENAVNAAFNGIKVAASLINMEKHHGEHPRFGAADVVPFIPISGVTIGECVELARKLGERVGSELSIPVYLYSEAATKDSRRNLENIRNSKFQYEQLKEQINREEWIPDYGPSVVGSAGASIIGARDFLIAYNVYLDTQDLNIGKKIATALRAKDGGLAFVKSLAFFIKEKNRIQISMNLTNFHKTPIYRALELVRLEAKRYGLSVTESEIVGLVPLDSILNSLSYYLCMDRIDRKKILEYKLLDTQ